MNKKYGIIIDGVLQYAPKKLKYNHKWYINPNARILTMAGYKKLVFEPYPYDEIDENHDVMEVYEETEDTIYVSYEVFLINEEKIHE